MNDVKQWSNYAKTFVWRKWWRSLKLQRHCTRFHSIEDKKEFAARTEFNLEKSVVFY